MLYLTRKIGESVVINDDIEVTVVDVRGKTIKLGFTFPSDATVLRREIYERIQEENRAAAQAGMNISEALKLKGKPPEVAAAPQAEVKKAQAK
ncbi:MAG TPA: carbon storage regulator CsrA [Alphaproteobacteria bacterium]|jgi:carbon storage regulator|nr:carbon storage regulator CsrA [Alphaproteobacteria bacterium]